MFGEFVKLALKSMAYNKLRTLLSLLGIIIGVASVIIIVNVGESASQSIQEQIAATGLETISIFSRTQERSVTREFNFELAERLAYEVPGILTVIPMNQINTVTRWQRNSYRGTILGVSEDFAWANDYSSVVGSFFTDADSMQLRQVAVLGNSVARELFPQGSAVGEYIRIFREGQAKSYRVVGVMERKSASFNLQYNQSIYIPFTTFSNRLVNTDVVQSYVVRTEPGVDVLAVSDNIEEYLTRLVGSGNYSVFSPSNIAELAADVTDTLSAAMASIAAISLLVGGIGIMNIMLVSVAERTKEIGIRKAIGASPRRIMVQFLIEAMTLTLVGGIIGIGLGIIVSNLAVSFFNWTFYPLVRIYFLAAGFSMTVGVFFGLYPAVKASKLDPIEALNYE